MDHHGKWETQGSLGMCLILEACRLVAEWARSIRGNELNRHENASWCAGREKGAPRRVCTQCAYYLGAACAWASCNWWTQVPAAMPRLGCQDGRPPNRLGCSHREVDEAWNGRDDLCGRGWYGIPWFREINIRILIQQIAWNWHDGGLLPQDTAVRMFAPWGM